MTLIETKDGWSFERDGNQGRIACERLGFFNYVAVPSECKNIKEFHLIEESDGCELLTVEDSAGNYWNVEPVDPPILIA